MDNHAVSWAPRPLLAVLSWVLAAVLAALAVLLLLDGDRAGPLLLAVGALAGVAAGCYTTLARPRLAADADGVRVRTLSGTHAFAWHETAVALNTTRRLGRDTTTLEIDTGNTAPHLIVFGRLELDADPVDVADTLHTLRGAGGQQTP